MANINQISLKVCGNPDANSGFQPMVIFNSPSIEIKDTVYAGFDANSYFFTIKIEKTQVVYKLIKNYVSSLGASRQGCLVIGIAIPKGYKLDAGVSPYEVLMELKKGFLTRCMTCKDPITDKYEFNSSRVQPNILDDVASSFSLIPAQTPYHSMSIGAPIAYVTVPEEKIKLLMDDVQYPAFTKFSEIVVAVSVQNTNYTPITNISIPRMPEYSIYDDGVLQPTIVSDPKQLLTITGKGDARFYENESLMFTLEELLNGESVPNVSIDTANEIINVSSKALIKPITRKINVVFVPMEAENYFLTRRNDWTLYYGNQTIPLRQDLSFELTGENLKALNTPQSFKILQSRKDQYEVKSLSVSSKEIRVIVEKVRRPVVGPIGGGRTGGSTGASVQNINACEVQLLLNQIYKRSHCCIQFYNEEELLQSSTALFVRGTDGNHMAKFYVPKSWAGDSVHVRIKYKDEHWDSVNNLGRDTNGVIQLHDRDFIRKPIGFFSKHSKTVILLFIMLLSLLAGGVIGAYVSKTWLNKNVTSETEFQETFSCEKCDKVYETDMDLQNHMSDEHSDKFTLYCPDCNAGPFDQAGLDGHKHECQKRIKCDECGEGFSSERDLNNHKTTAHPAAQPPSYHCDICNRDFTTASSLRAHTNDAHSPKKCKYCQRTFESQTALTAHMRADHHFVCTQCGSDTYFATQAELDAHKRGKRKDGSNHSR